MYHTLSAYPARSIGKFRRENEGKGHLLTFDILQSIYRRDRRPKIHTTPQGRAARSTWYEFSPTKSLTFPLGISFRTSKKLIYTTTGCAATCYALYRAYRSMKSGDSVEMNRMFRARIYAQAFTLVALVAGGMYFKTERQQRREFDQAVELRKKQEKRDAWLRELEIRDKEDREWRERHASIEAAAKEVGNKPAPPKEPEAARSSIEPADEKSIGIMDAVRALISRD